MFVVQHSSNLYIRNILAQATADNGLLKEGLEGPHHPIACPNDGVLELFDDTTMKCEHSTALPSCPRNQAIIDHMMAIVLIEEAVKQFDARTS